MKAQIHSATNPIIGANLASGESFGRSSSVTILVVENDALVRNFILQVLNRAGYRVVCVSNGREAIDSIDRDSVDLIITDLFMPQMDGMELVLHLRKQAETIPIIAISGAFADPRANQSEDMLRTARLLGAKVTLSKPFSLAELIVSVRQLVGDPAGRHPEKGS